MSDGVRQALLSHWLRCTGSTPRGPLPAPSSPQAPAGRGCSLLSRAGGRSDDVTHKGKKIDWGAWAITGDDPEFGGTGNPDRHRRRLRPCARRAPLLACVLFRQLEAKCRLLLNHGIVPASCGLGLGPGLWGPPGMIPHGRGLSSVSAAPFIALRSVQPAAGSLADRRASWEPWQAW